MLTRYLTVKENGQAETEIKKSRFICYLARVESEAAAKEIIQQIKKEHWKASHHCSAFIVGHSNQILRSNDDGEPAGTAGLPMLELLKKRELVNTLAVVTRYFGGTELGKGGLIRAYSGAVANALETIGIVEGNLQQEVIVTIDYSLHGKLENFSNTATYGLQGTNFSEVVTMTFMVDDTATTAFEEELTDLLNGQCHITLGEKAYFEKEYNPH